MNFLAHLYLTQKQPEEVVLGNFMADAIKGKLALNRYSQAVQYGIRIHREIDDFTDQHVLFRRGAQRLYPSYGKFAGIVMDVFYDYVLASHWKQYSDQSLSDFAQHCYQVIAKQIDLLPAKTKYWFQVMQSEDLLSSYASIEGMEAVFERMDRRMGYISGMHNAMQAFLLEQTAYEEEFHLFFEDIQRHLDRHFPLLEC